MVMRVKFVKGLPKDSGLKTSSNEAFSPEPDTSTVYTVTVRSDNYILVFIGSNELASGPQESLVQLIKTGHVEFF